MIPTDYLSTLARIESNNQLFAKARTSSASGLYQMIRATWVALGGKWGDNPAKAFGGLLPTVQEQAARARELAEQDATTLRRHGVPVSSSTLYAAHFLGLPTALAVLKAEPHAALEPLVGRAVVMANPFLEGLSVEGFRHWLGGRTQLDS